MPIQEFRGTTDPISSPSEEVEIDILNYGKPKGFEIVRVSVKQDSGSAGSFQFSIGNRPNFVSGDITEKYLSSSIVSSSILDETDVSVFLYSNINGKIYFRFAPDTGSDNVYSYSVMYKF